MRPREVSSLFPLTNPALLARARRLCKLTRCRLLRGFCEPPRRTPAGRVRSSRASSQASRGPAPRTQRCGDPQPNADLALEAAWIHETDNPKAAWECMFRFAERGDSLQPGRRKAAIKLARKFPR